MRDTLHPYQVDGAKFLASRTYAYLGDEMGLGKTPQAIHAADLIGADRILVVCPAIARINWAREFRRWSDTPRATQVVDKTTRAALVLGDVTIVSYEGAVKLIAQLSAHVFDLIIFDEFHYLKSVDAKRAKVLIGSGGLAHRGRTVWLLSGTAIANHPGEIWTGLRVFYPAALREPDNTFLSHDQFIERYCKVKATPYGDKVVGVKDLSPLKAAMQPFFLRRQVDDIGIQMPAFSWSDFAIQAPASLDSTVAPDAARQLTDWLSTDGAYQIEPADNTSSLMHYLGLEKSPAVTELVRDHLDSGVQKIVVFAWHLGVMDAIGEALDGYGRVAVHGSMSPEMKQAAIDKFQNDPDVRVFIGQIKACGTAIDLTAAHHVIFAEMSWVPSDNAQAAKRVHRVTQTKPVLIRCAKLVGSLDDAVTATLRRKSSMVNQLLN